MSSNILKEFNIHSITNSWKPFLTAELKEKYFKDIYDKYTNSKDMASQVNLSVYPAAIDIFKAFRLCDLENMKVCIIGMDPYHSICNKTQIPYANGLAFSVNDECSIPPSLRNIFKLSNPDSVIENGNLERWANQGVFLINSALSVLEGKPGSHGFWHKFTDKVIKYVSDYHKEEGTRVIFVLWGAHAFEKIEFIDQEHHKVFISSHPSPLGATKPLKKYPSFITSDVFNKINKELVEINGNSAKIDFC